MQAIEKKMSRADYVLQSAEWEEKYEWINGEIYGMSGGSFRHNAIGGNLMIALGVALKGKPCRPSTSDQRVFVTATEASFYPDLTVVCGPYIAAPDDPHALCNPALIVEVLSPSTRTYDLGAKLEHYLLIDTVQHLLLVETHEEHCILHSRTDDGWSRRDLYSGEIALHKLGVVLSVEAIYADLDHLPEEPTAPGLKERRSTTS